MSDQSIVEVTQADRDAAADWHQAQGNWIVDWHAMRRGEMDDCGTVQAFARHRIAEREACAMVAEELPWDDSKVGNANFDDTKDYVAAAIRARSDRVDDISYAGVGP